MLFLPAVQSAVSDVAETGSVLLHHLPPAVGSAAPAGALCLLALAPAGRALSGWAAGPARHRSVAVASAAPVRPAVTGWWCRLRGRAHSPAWPRYLAVDLRPEWRQSL